MTVRDAVGRLSQVLRRPLPEGGSLPDDVWDRRHRGMTLLLAAQAGVLVVAAGNLGHTSSRVTLVFWVAVAVCTGVALTPLRRRAWRTGAVATGLVACSLFAVQATGVQTESYFHLFVMLGVIALYQDWLPFLVAFGVAGAHHAVLGAAVPERVFGPQAAARPLAWLALHIGFLLAAATISIIAWRLGERDRRRAALVLDATADGIHGVDREGRITFVNEALARMIGTDADQLVGRHHHEALGHVSEDEDDCTICRTVTAGRRDAVATARLRAHDGTEVPVECAGTPLWEQRDITGAVVTLRDLSERQRLAEQALHDPLTGLANRTLLRAHLEHALAALDRRRDTAALLFCDLDRFKDVNDRLGHAAGDALLLTIAQRLQTAVRGHDTVARFGGDEFVLLLTDLSSARDVMVVAERVAEAIAEPVTIAGEQMRVSASVGVAVVDDPRTDPSVLLEEADLAMYRAKERGRDRIEVFDEHLRARANERMRLEHDLAEAIRDGELEIHYLPKVGLADGRLQGVEALVRWEREGLGPLEPDEFLSVAEDAGMMPELGAWVLEEACRQVQQWRALPGDSGLALSVNVSTSQLADPDLADRVRDVLARTGLPPALLCIEVGELSLADETPTTVETLHALKQLGVRLAVDDFGTGWSSLTYLSRVPIDVLKIDRSFVADIDGPGDSWSIVAAAIGLSQALGIAIVAEGVERQSQAQALQDLGYELAQGFHFHRPLPAHEMAEIVASTERAPTH